MLPERNIHKKEGELLGKLRYLKNVVEVCCLNSAASDFTGYGWTLAKDYATEVEDDVEQRLVAWPEMKSEVRTSTIVAAQMDFPRPVPKFQKEQVKVPEKSFCITYNKCATEGKCQYEVDNPTKTCQRKHECSWCKINLKRSIKHQAIRCKNKEQHTSG